MSDRVADKPPLILLVDDDPDFLEMNRPVLEAKGYRVVCSPDPQAALARMAEEKPHLVITDLMMKSLDSGFSFARKIKSDPRFQEIPVIIVTAVSSRLRLDFSPRSLEELAAMKADAYFDKPVAPDALLAKIQELLNRPAQE